MVSRRLLKPERATTPVAAALYPAWRHRWIKAACLTVASGLLLGLACQSEADEAVHPGPTGAALPWRVQDDVAADDTRNIGAKSRFDPMHALLPNTRSFVVRNGIQSYRVWLYTPPLRQSPGEAMPLLVLLDGNAMFPIALQAARLQQRLLGPLAIAAIAPDDDNLFDEAARYRDFTTPAADNAWGVPTFAALRAHETATRTSVPPHTSREAANARVPTGGAGDFRALISHIILPEIRRRVPIDPARTSLFGHSLGGFFVLDTVLHDRCLFSRYIAASPSLWWNDRQLLREASPHVAADCGTRPVMLQVGGAEQRLPPDAPAARVERVTRAAMLDNVMAMATLLRHAPNAYALEGPHVYPNGNHVSYLPAALSDAVRDATSMPTLPPSP